MKDIDFFDLGICWAIICNYSFRITAFTVSVVDVFGLIQAFALMILLSVLHITYVTYVYEIM